MSEKEANRFLKAVETDESFRETLNGMASNHDAVYAEIKKRGFDCTPEEIKETVMEALGSNISENDLADIAAGHTSAQSKFAIGLIATGGVILAAGAAAAAF